ncbi:MAG: hypothetical protein OEV89_07425 [Desulfobulbaceae bacterium]|nr:hypothetical protein [Desulfobulbaceae bacterium]HIJ90583.1 hypothetical protein [Deltaproteobacteria bacterium]
MTTDVLGNTLSQIEESLDLITATGLLTREQKPVLLKDIKYLLLDNIAKEIKLIFYNPDRPDQVFLEYVYTSSMISEPRNMLDDILSSDPSAVAFDVYIEFTRAFHGLDRNLRDLLQKNTEFEWYPVEGS